MAKITPVLWIHKQNAKGRSPIYLRISAGGKTKYKSLSVQIHPRHWNERSRRVRKSHRRSTEINTLITERLADAEGAVLERQREGLPVRPRHVKRELAADRADAKSGASDDYFAWADEVVERFRRRGQIYTHKRYKSCIKKFRQFTGEPLPFEELTPELLRRYEVELIEEHENNQTTRAANFAAIRSILNKAIADDRFPHAESPFHRFEIKQGKPERDKLSAEALGRIEELSLETGSLIWRVRSYFLFSLYCAGIRFGDVAKMQRSAVKRGPAGQPQRLVYKMSKTGHPMDLGLVEPARKIVAHYLMSRDGNAEAFLFPILEDYDTSTPTKVVNAIGRQNALVNKYLKKIAVRAGVEEHLSFHVARHSFATIALRRGWGVAEISQQLGHSGGLKVTEQYLKGFAQSDLDDKMNDLFGGE